MASFFPSWTDRNNFLTDVCLLALPLTFVLGDGSLESKGLLLSELYHLVSVTPEVSHQKRWVADS